MKFKITTDKRDGMVSLWINIPSHVEGNSDIKQNIWDLPGEHVTDSVMLAIAHAFELGMKAQANLVDRSMSAHTVSWSLK